MQMKEKQHTDNRGRRRDGVLYTDDEKKNCNDNVFASCEICPLARSIYKFLE